MAPISRREKPRAVGPLALHWISLALWAAAKFMLYHFFADWTLQCLDAAGGGEAILSLGYLKLLPFAAIPAFPMLQAAYINDIQQFVTSLVTLDRYEWLATNDWPFLSHSLREFWGRRYNRLISTLLRDSVFSPLRNRAGLSASVATFAAYMVSGAFHAHLGYVAFGTGVPQTLLFFAIHALLSSLETKLAIHKNVSSPVAIGLTLLLLLLSAPLYFAPFLPVCAQFLAQNPVAEPPFRLPVPNICPR